MARALFTPWKVFQCDVVLKVAPPSEKLDLLKIASDARIHSPDEHAERTICSQTFFPKKIIAIGYEFMHDDSGVTRIIQAMSEISSTVPASRSAEYMSNAFNGRADCWVAWPSRPPVWSSSVLEPLANMPPGAALVLSNHKVRFDNSVQ